MHHCRRAGRLAGEGDEIAPGDAAHDAAGSGERADAYGDVDAFVDDVDEAVSEPEVGGDHAVAREMAIECRRDVQAAEHRRRRHGRPAARGGALVLGQALGLLAVVEQLARAR